MTAVFYDIYLFSISTLFKILELARKKVAKKLPRVIKGKQPASGDDDSTRKHGVLFNGCCASNPWCMDIVVGRFRITGIIYGE